MGKVRIAQTLARAVHQGQVGDGPRKTTLGQGPGPKNARPPPAVRQASKREVGLLAHEGCEAVDVGDGGHGVRVAWGDCHRWLLDDPASRRIRSARGGVGDARHRSRSVIDSGTRRNARHERGGDERGGDERTRFVSRGQRRAQRV